jgi:Fic family protein
MTENSLIQIPNTPYAYYSSQDKEIKVLSERVVVLRNQGKLTDESLKQIRNYFKIKNIYNSNAIEGNSLSIGETREVIERGLTLTGKSLKDQAEAKNLSEALDFLETISKDYGRPISENEIKQIHFFILKDINNDNAGKYRNVDVEISGSAYKPTMHMNINSDMQDFTNWLKSVTSNSKLGDENAIIWAAVAHTWFVTIHPFIDGNGRTARILMNLILMRHGYPISIISKEDRYRYYDTLEIAQTSDLSAFLSLMVECIHEGLEEYEEAVKRQLEQQDWAKALAQKIDSKQQIQVKNRFEVWRSSMDLLKNTFRQTASIIDDNANFAKIYFSEFSNLDFEKYLALLSGESAKKTWFFRIDFKQDTKTIRYLFFFSNPSYHLKYRELDVTLVIAREEPQGSFNYTKLEFLQQLKCPNILEIGYSIKEEKFIAKAKGDQILSEKIEGISKLFFEEVIKIHFAEY